VPDFNDLGLEGKFIPTALGSNKVL
jgi:hypothetical protein